MGTASNLHNSNTAGTTSMAAGVPTLHNRSVYEELCQSAVPRSSFLQGSYPPAAYDAYQQPQSGYQHPQGDYQHSQSGHPQGPSYGAYGAPERGHSPYPPQQPPYSGQQASTGGYADPAYRGQEHLQGQQGQYGAPGGAGEGERGLGATLIGGAGGGFLGDKLGGGVLGTLGGIVAGAIGANALDNRHDK